MAEPLYENIKSFLRRSREDLNVCPASELAERALARSARFVERVERYLVEHDFLEPTG